VNLADLTFDELKAIIEKSSLLSRDSLRGLVDYHAPGGRGSGGSYTNSLPRCCWKAEHLKQVKADVVEHVRKYANGKNIHPRHILTAAWNAESVAYSLAWMVSEDRIAKGFNS
jgi:hypothetical protein